jgi:hypothetical protein
MGTEWGGSVQEEVLEALFGENGPKVIGVEFGLKSHDYTMGICSDEEANLSQRWLFCTATSYSTAKTEFMLDARKVDLCSLSDCHIECKNEDYGRGSVWFRDLTTDDKAYKLFILAKDICVAAVNAAFGQEIYYVCAEESYGRKNLLIGVSPDGIIKVIRDKDQLKTYFYQEKLQPEETGLISCSSNNAVKPKIGCQIQKSIVRINGFVEDIRESISQEKTNTSGRILHEIGLIYQKIQEAGLAAEDIERLNMSDHVTALQQAVEHALDLFPNDEFLKDCANNLLKILGDNVGIAEKNQQQLFLCR